MKFKVGDFVMLLDLWPLNKNSKFYRIKRLDPSQLRSHADPWYFISFEGSDEIYSCKESHLRHATPIEVAKWKIDNETRTKRRILP
jgi:hypothetical protein